MRDHVRFFLNGQPHTVRGPAAFATLSDYLRAQRLTGTKVVCAEGDCGACTVLVGQRGRFDTIDACIRFVCQLDGTHVITVEGLADHPVQRAMVECHGSQCGYCTPGFVMALAGWAEHGGDVRTALTGNLCRCTGYVPILEAAARIGKSTPLADRFSGICAEPAQDTVRLEADGRTFVSPTTLADALAFKAANTDAVILSGTTELGVLRNKRGYEPRALLSLARIPDIDRITIENGRVTISANATWTAIEREIVPLLPAFGPIVRRFGSPQIRNVGTLAGNVMNGSPIADSLPLLMVLDADLEIASVTGRRTRPLNGFYTGYKQKDLAAEELLTNIKFWLPPHEDRLRLYKVSRRDDLDIATFGAAIRMRVNNDVIERAAVAYSGVAATVVRMSKAEAALVGQPFREKTFRAAGDAARSEIAPLSDVRGGADYRRDLAANILMKFFYEEA